VYESSVECFTPTPGKPGFLAKKRVRRYNNPVGRRLYRRFTTASGQEIEAARRALFDQTTLHGDYGE